MQADRCPNGENALCITARDILLKLLERSDYYFSNGYLNSEGVKLLNMALRHAIRTCPERAPYLKKLRKTRSYEDLIKTLSVFELQSADP